MKPKDALGELVKELKSFIAKGSGHPEGMSDYCRGMEHVVIRLEKALEGKVVVDKEDLSDGVPALFRTKRESQAWIKKTHGYIATRKDLRAEPHGWRMPIPIRVQIMGMPRECKECGGSGAVLMFPGPGPTCKRCKGSGQSK